MISHFFKYFYLNLGAGLLCEEAQKIAKMLFSKFRIMFNTKSLWSISNDVAV